ncbi:MAG: hypothetical protein IPP77_05950 [Bacteroidetes bacterium]|nr:hypothetical protein [Bacteroidota bacterium]
MDSVEVLRDEYPIDEEYKKELIKFVKDKYTLVEKHWQYGSFDTARFLKKYILKSFHSLGPDGGTYFEHPQIRGLMKLYENKFDVNYKFDYKPGKNFGKVLVVATARKGKKEKEIAFAFEYLKSVMTNAAWVLAYLKFRENFKNELAEDSSSSIEPENTKHEYKPENSSNRMKWRVDRKHLESIFGKLARQTLTEDGRLTLVAKPTEIQKLIERNFEFSDTKQKVNYPDKNSRLIYNGQMVSFLRLLFYLSEKKMKGKDKPAFSPPDSWIINFVCRNFMRYNKQGVEEEIPVKSVKDEWLRIRRKFDKAGTEKQYDTLRAGNTNHNLLHILEPELSIFV